MADSIIALHNHIAGAFSRKYAASPRPRFVEELTDALSQEDGRMAVLLTAWGILLGRLAGQNEVLIGVHRNGRMLPIRTSLKGSPNSSDLVVQSRRELARAWRNLDWNYSVLRFQLTFGQAAEPAHPFQLHLHANVSGEGVSLRCDFNKDRYTEAAVTDLLRRYRKLLGAMAADPAMPITHLAID